jgi:hypothetical protein
MFILAIIVVVLVMLTATGFSGMTALLDIPSLWIPLLLTTVMLAVAGLGKDFLRGIRVAVMKENIYTELELKKSHLAIRLGEFIIVASGIVTALVGRIAILSLLSDPVMFNRGESVSLLSLMYSLFMIILLLPVDFKIKKLLLESEYAEEDE